MPYSHLTLFLSFNFVLGKFNDFNRFIIKLSSEGHLVATDTSDEVQVFLTCMIDNLQSLKKIL